MEPCVSLLRDLIAIESVNPSLVPGSAGEGAIAEAVAAAMRSAGLDVEVEDVRPGRPNVVGVLDGRADAPSLMFCGHLDTVGVQGMRAPFTPVERGGRLFGRGAQDMKGGLAAMIDAARLLAGRRAVLGRLVVAAVVDEEYASLGADALVTRWRADAAIVAEPTDLRIAVAHKGFAWLDVQTAGRAAHGSRPQEGEDAIVRMGRVLNALERLDAELQGRPAHPLLGTASVHASLIAGGQELSSYPECCTLQLERRTVPGEPADLPEREIRRLLVALREEDSAFRGDVQLRFSRPAYETPAGHPLPRILGEVVGATSRPAAPVGMSFWTDAAVLGSAGIPTVLFGPAGAGLHGPEEYVEIDSVLACRDALAALAERWWTERPPGG